MPGALVAKQGIVSDRIKLERKVVWYRFRRSKEVSPFP